MAENAKKTNKILGVRRHCLLVTPLQKRVRNLIHRFEEPALRYHHAVIRYINVLM